MQESTHFNSGTQKNKIGISFENVLNKFVIKEIRQENITVERVNEQYMQIMNKAMNKIAKSRLHDFSGNDITVDFCWIKRNSSALLRKLSQFISAASHSEFSVTIQPSEIRTAMYGGDAN